MNADRALRFQSGLLTFLSVTSEVGVASAAPF